MPSEKQMLIEQIISSPGKLSILHAPAGFGKTALLGEVLDVLSRRGAPVVRSWSRDSEAEPSPWILLDEPEPRSFAEIATHASRWGSRTNAGVVVATRHVGRLPVARLRADGRAVIYGPEQIGISRRDAASRLRAAIGRKTAEDLALQIDGWSVAVPFLISHARSSRARFDKGGGFVVASGLAAYIEEELLSSIPSDWADALCFASIFSSCDREMLDASRPEEDLGRHLAPLQAHFPGLVIDDGGQTRLNPLLRLHMNSRFEQLPKPVRTDALQRASQACSSVGRVAEAASLVTRAGDSTTIIDFVRRSQGLRLWVTAGFDVIREIVAQAGPRGVEVEPRLKLLKCMVHGKDGEIVESERLFNEVLPMLSGDSDALRDIDVCRISLQIYGCRNITPDDISRFRRYIMRNNDDPAWKTLILSLQSILSIQRGALDEAIASIVEGSKQARAAGTDYAILFLEIHSANAALARGDLQREVSV